jgi:hypothetical protein
MQISGSTIAASRRINPDENYVGNCSFYSLSIESADFKNVLAGIDHFLVFDILLNV